MYYADGKVVRMWIEKNDSILSGLTKQLQSAIPDYLFQFCFGHVTLKFTECRLEFYHCGWRFRGFCFELNFLFPLTTGVEVAIFADDIALFAKGNDSVVASEKLQVGLNYLKTIVRNSNQLIGVSAYYTAIRRNTCLPVDANGVLFHRLINPHTTG